MSQMFFSDKLASENENLLTETSFLTMRKKVSSFTNPINVRGKVNHCEYYKNEKITHFFSLRFISKKKSSLLLKWTRIVFESLSSGE